MDKKGLKEIWDKKKKNSKFYDNYDLDFYQDSKTDLREQSLICTKTYYNEVCDLCKLTKTDREYFDEVIETFCKFYDWYEKNLVNELGNHDGQFLFNLNFPTNIPVHLKYELSNIFDHRDLFMQ
ncbi:hypothetical protein COBT_001532 [Conglomerata obtusa]